MVIGVDIRVLGSGRKSGVEEYTEQLLAHMLPLDSSIRFKLFYSAHTAPLPWYPWLKLQNVAVHSFKISNRLLLTSSRLLHIPRIDKLLGGVDVFFAPHFFITALSPSVRRVTTFHDLSFEQFPEFFSLKQRLWHRFVSPSWQARFSDQIITVSDSTKYDVAHRYRIDPARITTIHSGVSGEFMSIDQNQVREFLRSNNLPEKFILFLGTLEPRKNIVGIIRAFTEAKRLVGMEDVHLVLAGTSGWLFEESKIHAETSAVAHSIHILKNISRNERSLLYAAAHAFVYPSFFEGFGFPPLEAMACGTPVITSHTSSLPEVVGDAGILINPYNILELSSAMHDVVRDQHLRQVLISRGNERVKQFSWDACATKTLEVLIRS